MTSGRFPTTDTSEGARGFRPGATSLLTRKRAFIATASRYSKDHKKPLSQSIRPPSDQATSTKHFVK